MDRDIGLDAHASSCTLGVMTPSGKRVGPHVVETNAPHAEKVVVAAVSESRGSKDDRRDAFGLAEGLRLGAIRQRVYKERGGFGTLGYRRRGTSLVPPGERATLEPSTLLRKRPFRAAETTNAGRQNEIG